jgi:hypothetical protein
VDRRNSLGQPHPGAGVRTRFGSRISTAKSREKARNLQCRNPNRLWLFKFRALSRDFAVRHPAEQLLPVRLPKRIPDPPQRVSTPPLKARPQPPRFPPAA